MTTKIIDNPSELNTSCDSCGIKLDPPINLKSFNVGKFWHNGDYLCKKCYKKRENEDNEMRKQTSVFDQLAEKKEDKPVKKKQTSWFA